MRPHCALLVMLVLAAALGVVPAHAQTPLDPTQTAARIGLARVARDQGRYQEAFGHFRDAFRGHQLELPVIVEYFWVAQRTDAETARNLAREILRKDPRNSAVRDGLIGVLAGAGNERELRDAAAAGANTEPASALWPRRLAESYLRTGDGARAAAYYEKAAALEGGTTADRALRALAIEATNDKAAALQAWNEVGESVWSSRPEWLASRERAVAATRPRTPVVAVVRPRRRSDATRAAPRAPVDDGDHGREATDMIEAAIGRGDFTGAMALAAPAASVADAPIGVREQYGLLLHWTGDDARAEGVLRAVVAESPSTRSVDALIEVLRANQHAEEAWRLAARRAELPTAPAAHRLASAVLSLETGRIEDALTRATALTDDPQAGAQARTVAARALIEAGRPVAARTALGSLSNDAGAALAWLEATAAVEGRAAALRAATAVAHETDRTWLDLTIKRVLWHAAIDQRADADRLLRGLDTVDPQMAAIARAELALADGSPGDAVAQLRPLANDTRLTWRVKELLSIALAEHGRWTDAYALLAELRQQRPNDMRLALREALWRHREMASDSTLHTIQAIVEQNPTLGEGPIVLARVLFAAGELERARSALASGASGSLEGRLLDAQLLAARGDVSAADAAFEQLVAGGMAEPAWYLAWADGQVQPARVRRVIEAGTAHFPDNPLLQERMAQAAWEDGDRAASLHAAALALAADGRRAGAWLVQTAAARGQSEQVAELARRFEIQFANSPTALLSMAELLADLAGSPGDAAALRALQWTTELQWTAPGTNTAATRVRLLAALGRRDEAMSGVDAMLARDPGQPAARKLRAELLMRFGDHVGAIAAYERYLEVAPGDLGARRQQARIEGWQGATKAALARYQAIHTQAPGMPAIEAEMAAKRAYFHGRWREAVSLYERWLAVEPNQPEALLERAQALDQLGDTRRAAAAYQALAGEHRVAAAAFDRLARRQAPGVDVFTVSSSADAASRRQLLDVTDAGAGFSIALGSRARTRLYAGRSYAESAAARWQGTLAGAEITTNTASPLDARANLTYRALNGVPQQWFGDARVTWQAQSQVRATLGVERVAVLENAQTVESGLSGFGPAATIHWRPRPSFTLDLRASRMVLDDQNVRQTFGANLSHHLVRRRNELRLLASTEHLAYAELRDTYFAPGGFWRHDVGGEWRGWLEKPRFFGDRERWIAAAYLYGADNRNVRYHTTRADFAYELTSGVSLVATGQIVRSAVYDSTRAALGFRVSRVPGLSQ